MAKSNLKSALSNYLEAVRLETMFPNSAEFEAKITAAHNEKVQANADTLRLHLIRQNETVGVVQSRVEAYLKKNLKK